LSGWRDPERLTQKARQPADSLSEERKGVRDPAKEGKRDGGIEHITKGNNAVLQGRRGFPSKSGKWERTAGASAKSKERNRIPIHRSRWKSALGLTTHPRWKEPIEEAIGLQRSPSGENGGKDRILLARKAGSAWGKKVLLHEEKMKIGCQAKIFCGSLAREGPTLSAQKEYEPIAQGGGGRAGRRSDYRDVDR